MVLFVVVPFVAVCQNRIHFLSIYKNMIDPIKVQKGDEKVCRVYVRQILNPIRNVFTCSRIVEESSTLIRLCILSERGEIGGRQKNSS